MDGGGHPYLHLCLTFPLRTHVFEAVDVWATSHPPHAFGGGKSPKLDGKMLTLLCSALLPFDIVAIPAPHDYSCVVTMPTPGNLHITDINHGGYVATTTALCTVWMLFFYLARVYVRIKYTPWGYDDWVLSAGTVRD